MDMKEGILLALYVIAIAFIGVFLLNVWEIALILFIVLVITIIQRIVSDQFREQLVAETKEHRERVLSRVTARLDTIAQHVDTTRKDVNKNMFVLANRLDSLRTEQKAKQEDDYRELVKSIIGVENKVTRVRKMLEAAYESLDERIKRVEGV